MLNRTVVDARPESQSKTSADRQKFVRRAKAQIKEAVKKAISEGDIKSLEKGKIKVPVKDMDEPQFEQDGKSGTHRKVLTGNKGYIEGDEIEKPNDSDGTGGTEGSPDGEGQDDFTFILTPDEFYDFLFEDLQLPDLIKKSMKTITKIVRKRAGYVTSGNPAQLDIKQTYKYAFARHEALGRPSDEELNSLREHFEINHQLMTEDARHRLISRIEDLEALQSSIPFIDDIDLCYRNYPPRPEPITKAVMFCALDVSGSMDEKCKDLAKRFYLLLYVWLMKQYNGRVEIVFIRHHTEAQEVDEETFFHSREGGGTVVSPMIELISNIVKQRYSPLDWNIYACHASDGDNWTSDNARVYEKLNALMPTLQYFAYLQVAEVNSNYETLWQGYEKVSKVHKNMHQVLATEPEQIWPVFKELFTKDLQR